MMHISGLRMFTVLSFGLAVYVASAGAPTESRSTYAAGTQLDQLIPRDKWAGSGLDKLTVSEQQALAGQIAALLGAAQSTGNGAYAGKDRSQWRQLQRRMSKDDVRKLLGEPLRVSVSRFYEAWEYFGGTVVFDGKGHVDSWNET